MRARRHIALFTAFVALWVAAFPAPVPAVSSVPAPLGSSLAQEGERYFAETGKSVRGRFLQQWSALGGLPQHGYPLTAELDEISALDGKVYTVQYFERSIFEKHPRNEPPYDVLLELLGTQAYKVRYPDGAPGQQPNPDPGVQTFRETGKRLGGRFLSYWKETGGLMRHGFPISDEFREVSPLNGKPYTVQYFERSVLELHPENSPPYDVLLSQLGRLALKEREAASNPLAPPNEWPMWDPMDPSAPELIVPGEKGHRLKQDWEVARIEYTYQMIAFGGESFNYHKVERTQQGFTRNGEPIPTELVHTFLRSLDHLYPTEGVVGSAGGVTDFYPYWAVEIVGADGNHILISSTNTGNAAGVPWSVLYNGRMYGQYDGLLVNPMYSLFPVEGSYEKGKPIPLPAAPKVSGGRYLPPQIRYGFWGLFPFADTLRYMANPGQGAISGQFGLHSYHIKELGQINDLRHVEIKVNGIATPCKIDRETSTDWWLYWDFSCSPGDAAVDKAYLYPITVTIGTSAGKELVMAGELWGKWGQDRRHISSPPSLELRQPFASSPDLTDLLADHVLLRTTYVGSTAADNPMSGERNGTVILAGKTSLYGKPTRYTVGTRFKTVDGQIKYWTLSRAKLRDLLRDVAALPLTRHILSADPTVVINLWYAEDPLPSRGLFVLEPYSVAVHRCGPIQGGTFPVEGKPLRAFTFNEFNEFGESASYGLHWPEDGFVLIDGKPVVYQLHLNPSQNIGAVTRVLLPRELNTGAARPWDRVWLEETSGFDRNTGRKVKYLSLRLESVYGPTEAEKAAYERIVSSLPGTLEEWSGCDANSCTWMKRGISLALQENGDLRVVGCQP
jgi:hypothetical protein